VQPVLAQQPDGARSGRGDDLRAAEDPDAVAPGQPAERGGEPARQRGVADEVLRHEVVGRHDGHALAPREAAQRPAYPEMGLYVNHVGCDAVEQPDGRPADPPGGADAEAGMERGAVRGDAVNRRSVVPGYGALCGGTDDMDVMTTLGETDGQAVREVGRAVDVGRIGVRSDDDALDGHGVLLS